MDHLAPPTAALQNLTITDPLSPPTTAPQPRIQNPRTISEVYLNYLLRQVYGPSKTCRSSMLANPQQSYDLEERIKIARYKALERVRGGSDCTRKKLSRLLRDMAKRKPEHRDKLRLAIHIMLLHNMIRFHQYIHYIMSMDHLAPPTAALQNLTITDSLSPPTTAPQPRIQNRDPPTTLSDKESHRRVYLNHLLRQVYGPSKTSWSSRPANPQPSYDLPILARMKIVRLQALLKRVRGGCDCPRKKLSRLLRDMAKRKPEHWDKLRMLANLYIQQRKNN